MFSVFLKMEYSQENIMFYEECQQLGRLSDENETFEKIRSIYDVYISTESMTEVRMQ